MKSQEKQKKQHYEKPVLRPIELVAEEILAVGCKSVTTGTAPRSATPPCMIRHCAGKGS